jgi:hypothetical protein
VPNQHLGSHQVDRQLSGKGLGVGIHHCHRSHITGVAHQNFNRTHRIKCPGTERCDRFFARHIELECNGLTACVTNALSDLLASLDSSATQHNRMSLSAEANSNSAADACASAGDHGRPTLWVWFKTSHYRASMVVGNEAKPLTLME